MGEAVGGGRAGTYRPDDEGGCHRVGRDDRYNYHRCDAIGNYNGGGYGRDGERKGASPSRYGRRWGHRGFLFSHFCSFCAAGARPVFLFRPSDQGGWSFLGNAPVRRQPSRMDARVSAFRRRVIRWNTPCNSPLPNAPLQYWRRVGHRAAVPAIGGVSV